MMKPFNIALFAVVCLTLVACTKSRDHSVRPTDQLSYGYTTQLESDQLSDPAATQLATKINAKQTVSFAEISALLIKMDQKEFNQEVSPFARLSSIVNALGTKDYLKLKMAYEKQIETAEEKIQYQREASTVFHVTETKRVQCFSGTNMNLLMTRMSRIGSEYRSQHYVVIIKAGRALPGQMINTAKGWYLVGVETTATGDALVPMGLVKNLYGALRIVDAESYVISEVFRDALKGLRGQAFRKEAIDTTAKMYGISVEPLEQAINSHAESVRENALAAAHGSAIEKNSEPKYNETIFAFAPADMLTDVTARTVQNTLSADDFSKAIVQYNELAKPSLQSKYGTSSSNEVYSPRMKNTGVSRDAKWPQLFVINHALVSISIDNEFVGGFEVAPGNAEFSGHLRVNLMPIVRQLSRQFDPAVLSSVLESIVSEYQNNTQTFALKPSTFTMMVYFRDSYGKDSACVLSSDPISKEFESRYIESAQTVDRPFKNEKRHFRIRCEYQDDPNAVEQQHFNEKAWVDFWEKTLAVRVVGRMFL